MTAHKSKQMITSFLSSKTHIPDMFKSYFPISGLAGRSLGKSQNPVFDLLVTTFILKTISNRSELCIFESKFDGRPFFDLSVEMMKL